MNQNNNFLNNTKSKGHKLVAAIYLATNHLSDMDPLRRSLRSYALSLIKGDVLVAQIAIINELLQAAVLAKMMSEKNVSLISYELLRFGELMTEIRDLAPNFFQEDVKKVAKDHLYKKTFGQEFPNKRTYKGQNKIVSSFQSIDKNLNKNDFRTNTIMSFMSDKKSATIKDISSLFSDVSEKTIQRDLGTLVATGKLTKRGDKRWSVYLLAQ